MVKIRLTRVGATKRPCYRVIAIDGREKRDGRPLEYLGTYDPRPSEEIIHLRPRGHLNVLLAYTYCKL